jgi:hypothetical protein
MTPRQELSLRVAETCEPCRNAAACSSEQTRQRGLLLGVIGNHSDWERWWHLKTNFACFFLRETATKLDELSSGLGLLLGDKYS